VGQVPWRQPLLKAIGRYPQVAPAGRAFFSAARAAGTSTGGRGFPEGGLAAAFLAGLDEAELTQVLQGCSDALKLPIDPV